MSRRLPWLFFAAAVTPLLSSAEGPSFRNDVMAAMSKAGCNLGTCHGNATGKGGFKLSLRGQDIEYDFAALTRDVSGRRVNAFSPEQSLILAKGTNQLSHEGGKKLDPKGWEYQVLRDWIAAGMPRASEKDLRVTKLEVTPREQIIDEPQSEVQLKAVITMSDGTQRDVTERVVYEPLQNGLIEVSRNGLVKRLQFGEPGVLVRYLQHNVPVRLTFVRSSPQFVWTAPRRYNYVDAHIFSKLKTLRINPSDDCGDEVFMRRAYLDLLGIVPKVDEAMTFVADKTPDKRARLIDRLLVRQEFADFWALKWSDVLKVEGRTLDEQGMKAFHGWIRDAIARNRPMNEFVSEMISSRGSTYHEPASNFYRANRTPQARAVAAAQVFLGTRLQCAECHNHPFDRWTQDDYYSWSAIFSQVDYKILDNKRRDKNDKHEFKGEQVVFLNPKLNVQNPRTGDQARPRFLGADMPKLADKQDELQAAAAWLTSPANPLFAKAQVNRVWYHLMGKGLVDPVDDFRLTNPASHPRLLDELTEDFVRSGFNLKHLVRTIMLSRTYQLDSAPNATNAADEANYSHALPRRLTAEQLFDSLHNAMWVRPSFDGAEPGTRAGQMAGPKGGRGSPDPMSPEAFLIQFGKPKRELSCECERANDTTIGQIFQFMSGPVVGRVIRDKYNRLQHLAKIENPAQIVRDLYWSLLTRAPTADEAKVMESLLTSSQDKRGTLEDITWSLVNAKEFVLRR
ncbi:DUF1549 and DUF1553 domain-containing protein [Brevifollis gellanilyticus]|uniref:Surface protein n=1 Tax=Brevifollis gellanilyticus TaxID=748831 RepID=A0A512M9L6_9BACT|nr:DUF1549 and DUF1553 domain-containing protein [Brevifollis gellanilyticus]GEP43425.1 surface protein [Brevifollis gellanilyticus]